MEPQSEGASLLPIRRLALFLACSAIIVGLRFKSFDEPLERDHATYAVVGHEILRGRGLYSDLWDNKPPGIFWTYAGGELVFGYGARTVFLLGLLAAVATLPGLYAAASGLEPRAGVWAALFWSIACHDLVIQANQPNAEAFMNLWIVCAVGLLASRPPGTIGFGRALAAGAFLAAASAYKQVVVFIALPLAIAVIPWAGSPRRAAGLLACLASPGVLLWGAMAGTFALAGTFPEYYQTVFVHSRNYAGSLSENLLQSISAGRLTALAEHPLFLTLGLLAAVGLLGGSWKAEEAWRRALLAAWLVGSHLAVAAPGKFYPHYDQLLLPPLIVAASLGVVRLAGWLGGKSRAVAAVVGLAYCGVLLLAEVPVLALSGEGYSKLKYDEVFLNVRDLGRSLRKILEPGESFYQWGPEPGLFFYSEIRPTTGVLWDVPLYDSVMAPELTARTLRDLERRPELIVRYSHTRNMGLSHPILDLLAREYRKLDRLGTLSRNDPEFYILSGGALERRHADLTWDAIMNRSGRHANP
jgi:4-amino-4-deoxy-L-arabinose transferase-like glycosyltransferase